MSLLSAEQILNLITDLTKGAVRADVEVITGSTLDEITPSTLFVTNASQQALAANTNRKYVILTNDSDTIIYINVGADAIVGGGITRLNPSGGAYEMSAVIGNLMLGAVTAIHGGTGNKNLIVAEGV